MKLIDILVEELPKRGGWPEGCHAITQDSDKAINEYSSLDGVEINEHGTWRAVKSWNDYCVRAVDAPCLAVDYHAVIITRDQYESALAAKNDGWIDWGGGECPVEKGTLVDVKWRDGRIDDGIPAKISHDLDSSKRNAISWRHHGSSHDIIAYRLHQPQETEHAEADDEADLNECIGQHAASVWDGEGLPPIGAKVVFFINPRFEYPIQGMPTEGREIEVVAHKKTSDGNDVAVCYWDENGGGRAVCLVPESLMPAKSETERKREEAVQALCNAGGGNGRVDEKSGYGSCWFDIYDAIAAGKIPGVKLEN